MPATRDDQILATFSMTAGTGAYTGAFTAVTGFRTPAAALGNGVRGKFTVKACASSSNLTPTGDWEQFEGTVSTSGSGSISRDRFLKSSTGSAINWANPTTCFIEGSVYADDITTGGGGAFGDGSDGAVTFNGSSTVLGLVPSGNTYTLTRDLYCTDITIDAGVTIVPNGYGIYATGTLTNNGAISANGANGTNGSSGGAGTGGAGAQPNRDTIWGAATTAGNGANGVTAGLSSAGMAATAPTGTNVVGGNGGAGGGVTAPTNRAGGAGASPSAPTYLPRSTPAAVAGVRAATSWRTAGGGGGSGAATISSGSGTTNSGGGGGGGGWVLVCARDLVNHGTISANGGNGGNGYVSGAGNQAAGGSAGGGGGGVYIVYGTLSGAGTITANGGSPGTGATFGTGSLSVLPAAGSAGTVMTLAA